MIDVMMKIRKTNSYQSYSHQMGTIHYDLRQWQSSFNTITKITLKVGLAGESVVGSYSYRDEVEKLLKPNLI